MTIAQKYLEELERESAATRNILQAVPLDKSDWKPHPKSMSLGRLATHVAEIPSWFKNTLEDDELDFQKSLTSKFLTQHKTIHMLQHE
ncbi:MAG TPA: hypothetical protein P5565_07835, partial [Bacteroidia bacterium]|nr:hypothetical protein [Bacteroidia bacterium]